jgi:hypothetical protein
VVGVENGEEEEGVVAVEHPGYHPTIPLRRMEKKNDRKGRAKMYATRWNGLLEGEDSVVVWDGEGLSCPGREQRNVVLQLVIPAVH